MRRTHLNPAFKRFQYLPHAPAVGPGKEGHSAPRAGDLAAKTPVPPELLAGGGNALLGLQSPPNVQSSGPA